MIAATTPPMNSPAPTPIAIAVALSVFSVISALMKDTETARPTSQATALAPTQSLAPFEVAP